MIAPELENLFEFSFFKRDTDERGLRRSIDRVDWDDESRPGGINLINESTNQPNLINISVEIRENLCPKFSKS
jgi:hypothetical protein